MHRFGLLASVSLLLSGTAAANDNYDDLLTLFADWRAFELRSCQLMEIRDGRIVRFRIYQDTARMVDAWRS